MRLTLHNELRATPDSLRSRQGRVEKKLPNLPPMAGKVAGSPKQNDASDEAVFVGRPLIGAG